MVWFVLAISACLVQTEKYNEIRNQIIDGDDDGFSIMDGDCDDYNSLIFPGQVETCDGLDNDCDGFIDGDGAVIEGLFFDEDGDGFGNEKLTDCSQLNDSIVSFGGDCDDANSYVNPSVGEICGDGIDNNCDGSAVECQLAGVFDISDIILWEKRIGTPIPVFVQAQFGFDSDGDYIMEGMVPIVSETKGDSIGRFDFVDDSKYGVVLDYSFVVGPDPNGSLFLGYKSFVEKSARFGRSVVLLNQRFDSDLPLGHVFYDYASGELLASECDAYIYSSTNAERAFVSGVGDMDNDGLNDAYMMEFGGNETRIAYIFGLDDDYIIDAESNSFSQVYLDSFFLLAVQRQIFLRTLEILMGMAWTI